MAMQNKKVGKCRVKQGLHTTGREVIREWGYGSKSPTESIYFSIGIHLRNPCGAYRPIATAVYNPKAQSQTTNTRKRRLTTD